MTERKLGTNSCEMSLSRARWRRRGRGRALRNTIVLALVTAGWSSVSPPAGASEVPAPAASQAGPVWVCRPAQAADPCASDLAVSAVTATGAVKPATWPRSALASKFDCFYVLPTNSLATTPNTGLTVTTLERFIAVEQAAPLSTVCNVWAPVYRSQTWTSVREGLAGNEKVMTSTFKVAYQSVLQAWDWFLSHTGGEPVVLVGDSQGSAVLIHLISSEWTTSRRC
jgi:Protein of unknown function (DUF3089)